MKKILLVGNPNTGKTTLLNTLTKSHEHTGNWHGVTVEEKEKFFVENGEKVAVLDLPGLYSLNALSFEEGVAIKHIFSTPGDLIVCACDVNVMRKNLYLALELLLAGKTNIVLAVNTMGKKKFENPKFFPAIKSALGVDCLFMDFSKKDDAQKLKSYIQNFQPKENKINFFDLVFSKQTNKCFDEMQKKTNLQKYEILKYFEKNNYYFNKINKNKLFLNYFSNKNINCFDLIKEKYAFIDKILTPQKSKRIYGNDVLDRVLLNKFLAVPCFLAIMPFVFWATFFAIGPHLADALSNLLQVQIGGAVVSGLEGFCKVPWVISFVEDGIFGGALSLVEFLPQVVMLFLALSIMEDTGYFARVSFVFEDIFRSVGLSGKSIYTLLMGFGCSASAITTTRALDNKNAKIKTALITPFMSCSAKLPVYAVIGGAFFGAANIWVIFSLYLLGIMVALLISIILDRFLLKSPAAGYLQEFPPYRVPKFSKVLGLTYQNMKAFLVKVATIFVSMSIIVWCLGSFSFSGQYVAENGGISILQTIGGVLAPLFAPLGFNNWGAVSALLAGFVAKEIIVSSIAIFNGISGDAGLGESLLSPESAVWFTAGGAAAYLAFCLLYTPCLATVAILKKETTAKWTIFAVIMQILVAYLVAFMVFNLHKLTLVIGFGGLCAVVVVGISIIFAFLRVWEHLRGKDKCKLCGRCK